MSPLPPSLPSLPPSPPSFCPPSLPSLPPSPLPPSLPSLPPSPLPPSLPSSGEQLTVYDSICWLLSISGGSQETLMAVQLTSRTVTCLGALGEPSAVEEE